MAAYSQAASGRAAGRGTMERLSPPAPRCSGGRCGAARRGRAAGLPRGHGGLFIPFSCPSRRSARLRRGGAAGQLLIACPLPLLASSGGRWTDNLLLQTVALETELLNSEESPGSDITRGEDHRALILMLTSTAVISLNTSVIACLLIKQNSSISGSSEPSASHESRYDVDDLGCYLNSQSTEDTYATKKNVEVGVLENAKIKVITNISESITCLWIFKETQDDCKSFLKLENRHVVSMEFRKIRETQAGKHVLLIKTKTNNYTVTFTFLIRRSPRKPYFIKNVHSPTVTCISEGYPKPVLKWSCEPDESCKRDPEESEEKDALYETQKAKLNLTTEKLLFGPHVKCCATNVLGKACTELYTIDLNGSQERKPVFFLRPGDPLFLRCRAVYSTSQFGLKWYFENEKLNKSMSIGGTHSATYWIKNRYAFASTVGKHNGGNYICSSDISGSREVSVKVLDKDFINIISSTYDFEVDIEEKTCLEITLEAYPPIRCIWIFSQRTFPCEQKYIDVYSISSKFCDHKYQPGEYIFYAENGENGDTNVTRTLRLYVKRKPEVSMHLTPNQIECISVSYPVASLVWRKCSEEDVNCTKLTEGISSETREGEMFGSSNIISILKRRGEQAGFFVSCCANNSVDSSCKTIFLPKVNAVFVPADNVALYGIIGFCFLFIGLLFILIYHNHKKQSRYESQLQMIHMVGPSDNEYIYVDFSEIAYDLKWEFPRENLEFGQILGSGAFGKVVNAAAYGINETGVSVQVAVKMLKEKHSSSEKDALMSELKMMTHIGSHENIVNLLGACTVSGPIYLIFEYCCYGDLLNYLRTKRERFHKTWTDVFKHHNFSFYHNFPELPDSRKRSFLKNGSYMPVDGDGDDFGNMHGKQDLESTSKLDGIALLSEIEEMKYMNKKMDDEEDLNVLTFEDLLYFSYQVAKGMEFLESRSCVHRDLAARNVLVTHGKVAKICDFGLARDIVNDSNYIVRGNARLPVKWMSPESLFEGIYTIKSDVWSYGILLWEIFSLGVNPYPGMQVDSNFYKLIQSGFKMDRPFYATEEIYLVLCSCWALDSRKRPSFSQLLSLLACQLAEAEGAEHQTMKSDSSEHIFCSKGNPPRLKEVPAISAVDDGAAREK
ncbi:receptor-type tyrosine-protein kinase FLT3 [Tiliqua scincoides]|uniref:receptor-type tyrosine-protein kinase FLT3 n=1 Tax=Tiliqua scincoides TaxID=71010 RepID=UPI00346333A0